MAHYVAVIEDAGPNAAVGIWFPDLPGCFSAGDSVDEALLNAEEAIAAYEETLRSDGRSLPPPRRLSDLRANPEWSGELSEHMVALIAAPAKADAA
jgi:predicted RNase H-like HicB family nuclease